MSGLSRFVSRLQTPTFEIICDIDDELRFHLEEAAAHHESLGLAPHEARDAALAEMGDYQRARRECIRAATAPARAVRGVAAVLVLAACGFSVVGIGAARSQTSQSEARLRSMQDQLETLRSGLAAVRGGNVLPMAQSVNFITIEGGVRRPRLWTLPRNTEPTLRQLIERSGGLASNATGEIVISRLNGRAVTETIIIDPTQWHDPEGPDPVLEGFYHVVATMKNEPAPQASAV